MKMAFRLMHFVKIESLAMKANHPLATYDGIFVIVLNAEKKKLLRKTIQEDGRKNPLNKSLKKYTKQVIQKLTSLENLLENLTKILKPEQYGLTRKTANLLVLLFF